MFARGGSMMIKIEFKSKTPIYKQLRKQIIEGIASGDLQPGESMPSVRQMAEDIGINLHTVNKTYQILKNQGYLISHRRKKVVVNSREKMIDPDYKRQLEKKLRPIIAESICQGVEQKEFKNIVSNLYDEIQKE